MRTTLVISNPVYKRARKMAKEKGIRLSTLATEAMEELLLRMEAEENTSKQQRPVCLKPFSMGVPEVDIDNREELYRKMEKR